MPSYFSQKGMCFGRDGKKPNGFIGKGRPDNEEKGREKGGHNENTEERILVRESERRGFI